MLHENRSSLGNRRCAQCVPRKQEWSKVRTRETAQEDHTVLRGHRRGAHRVPGKGKIQAWPWPYCALNIWNGVAVCSIKIRPNCEVTRRTVSSIETGTGALYVLHLSEPWGILYKIYKN